MAVSGAILRILTPLPRHNDSGPPSLIMYWKLPRAFFLMVKEPWTWQGRTIAPCIKMMNYPNSSIYDPQPKVKGDRLDNKALTWRKTLSRSKGAVPERDTAPATAPAISCLHTYPDFFSSSENSSGTVSCSPMSNIYWSRRRTCITTPELSMSTRSRRLWLKLLYQWAFPVARHLLHVAQGVEQEVVPPLVPVDGHGAIFIDPERATEKNKLAYENVPIRLSTKKTWWTGSCNVINTLIMLYKHNKVTFVESFWPPPG